MDDRPTPADLACMWLILVSPSLVRRDQLVSWCQLPGISLLAPSLGIGLIRCCRGQPWWSASAPITEVAAKRARPLQTQQIPPLHNFRSPVPSRPLPTSREPYLPRFRSLRHRVYQPARFGIPTDGSLSLQVSCDRSDTGKNATFHIVSRKPNRNDPSLNSLLTCIDGRFAARRSGLASDGLARAVRPAGLAEAPRSRVCAKRRDRRSAVDAGDSPAVHAAAEPD